MEKLKSYSSTRRRVQRLTDRRSMSEAVFAVYQVSTRVYVPVSNEPVYSFDSVVEIVISMDYRSTQLSFIRIFGLVRVYVNPGTTFLSCGCPTTTFGQME